MVLIFTAVVFQTWLHSISIFEFFITTTALVKRDTLRKYKHTTVQNENGQVISL